LLGDFRKNLLGFGSLEAPPPKKAKDETQVQAKDEAEASARDKSQQASGAQGDLDIGKGDYEGW
jgi:hypothetical protein